LDNALGQKEPRPFFLDNSVVGSLTELVIADLEQAGIGNPGF
jgi:hypothetical protein